MFKFCFKITIYRLFCNYGHEIFPFLILFYDSHTILIFEQSRTLSHFIHDQSMIYCCVNAIKIKRSMGFKLEKSDKADSYEIARFAWLHKDELTPRFQFP